jgi:hypothetical protein
MTAALLSLNRRTFASLRHRNYRLFFSGQVVSVTGTWMQRVAQAWLVLQLTRSPIAVGILALAQFLPFTLFGLFAGVIVDRLDARKAVIGTQAANMALASLMAALALSGLVQAWQVYVIAFLMGTVQVLDAPARQALTFRMVGPNELPNAVALNSSLFNAARIFGTVLRCQRRQLPRRAYRAGEDENRRAVPGRSKPGARDHARRAPGRVPLRGAVEASARHPRPGQRRQHGRRQQQCPASGPGQADSW